MSEDSVRAARDALVDAGAALSRRANRDVVAALARVVDGFADPGSEWRRALARDLPEATGFHPETVQRGLAVGFDAWAGTDLARLASRQRLGEDRLDDATPEWTSGFASTSVLLAGAIPMPTLLALVFPLALRSPVLVRASAADPVTPERVQASLAETDPELGAAVRIVRFDSADDEAWRTWFEAPCLVATGSDATVKALAGRAEPWQRFVGYGHRESFAALGPDALDGPALTDACERLALDLALWDQLGCLSPVACFAASSDPTAAPRLAEALAEALAATEAKLPRGRVETESAAFAVRERDEALLRAAGGRPISVYGGELHDAYTVVCEDTAELRPCPRHRFIRVHPVPDAAGLTRALAPAAPQLAAVAIEGFGPGTPELAEELARLGASRLCAPGRLQAPPLGWHHDGRSPLAPLARTCDWESPSPSLGEDDNY